MRGEKQPQLTMLSIQKPDDLVPKDHPLRFVKGLADAALWELTKTFDGMYSKKGRPSIPPERLLKATLYRWVFRGNGAAGRRRFDHVFASKVLAARECRYVHELRDAGLSDHSPIEVVLGETAPSAGRTNSKVPDGRELP